MRTIVTHKNPHLDEIACIWLVKKYLPGWSGAKLKFVPTNPSGGAVKNPDKSAGTMYIGVGRGKFDEHKGNIDDSATTLVYKFIFKEKKVKIDKIESAALAELIEYVNNEDHGKHIDVPFAEFSVAGALANLPKVRPTTSVQITAIGSAYFDGVLEGLKEKCQLAQDWKKSVVVKTPWGKACAVETTVSAKVVLRRAVQDGAEIVITLNPKNKFRSIRAFASAPVDLSQPFEQAHRLEPRAEWYLHHSKRMLICGSDVAENKSLSKMTLSQLSQLVSV